MLTTLLRYSVKCSVHVSGIYVREGEGRLGCSWLGKASECHFEGFRLGHRQWGALAALCWCRPDGGVMQRSWKGEKSEMPKCLAGAPEEPEHDGQEGQKAPKQNYHLMNVGNSFEWRDWKEKRNGARF